MDAPKPVPQHPLRAMARASLARLHRTEMGKTTSHVGPHDRGVRVSVQLRGQLNTVEDATAHNEATAWLRVIRSIADKACAESLRARTTELHTLADVRDAEAFVAAAEKAGK